MADAPEPLVVAETFPGSWAATSFRGVEGSWLGVETSAVLDVERDGWTVLEGVYFEGADQVSGATAVDDLGAPVDLACDVNVDGSPGSWRLALRRRSGAASKVTVKLPYVIDLARGGLFCSGAHWVPERSAQVRLRWLGAVAAPRIRLDEERAPPAQASATRKIRREIDVATLEGAHLRAVSSYLGAPERWTNASFDVVLTAAGAGWWSARLWGRNCLGARQISEAKIAIDGVPASFFCRVHQEESGLNWSIDAAVYTPASEHRFVLAVSFPDVETDMADGVGLGACLGGLRLAGAVIEPDAASRKSAIPFAWDADRLRDQTGAGAYGRHILIAPSEGEQTFGVTIRDATVADYVLAFSGGESLREHARIATEGGVTFRFATPDGSPAADGWRLVTIRRSAADGSPTDIVAVDV